MFFLKRMKYHLGFERTGPPGLKPLLPVATGLKPGRPVPTGFGSVNIGGSMENFLGGCGEQ